jgi:asparaginyl-tRNA synthetase
MEPVKIKDAFSSPVDSLLTIKGWVRTKRDSKAEGGLSFISISDGTCFDAIQVVATGELANYQDEIQKITTGCALEVEGTLKESLGKGQKVEIQAKKINVIGWIEQPDSYPISPKRHSFEYLREVAHLRARTNTFGAVARVRHCLSQAIHRFFDERDFFYIHTPIITASDCEGAGEMFRVSTLDLLNLPITDNDKIDFDKDFFGKEARLTVSGQLSVETYCCALSRVYTFGPTFRAENSNTSRHLSEFWMIEPEIAFADLNDDADLAEEFLKYLFDDLLTKRADDMAFFDKRIEKGTIERLKSIVNKPFLRLSYTDAIETLIKSKQRFEFPVEWGIDLQSEHERYLTEVHYKQPLIVMNYPKDIKAFYMRSNDDQKTVAAMDVLVPKMGEIIGGSQREERLDLLDKRITEMNLDLNDYWWYRDLRRYGTVPHCGFGLGFERLIQFCTGMANIRDVIPFPRAPRQAEF